MSILSKALERDANRIAVEGRLRSQIREIVRAYRHSWDIYSELIQNSVDAINRRFRILNDPDFFLYDEFRRAVPGLESDMSYTGRIELIVNVLEGTIEIRDNGVGIPAAKLEEFLLPEGTDKTMNQEYGFKGFGLTFAAFISEEFSIISRPFTGEPQAHELDVRGLFSWLASENNTVPFPSEPLPDAVAAKRDFGDWNTVVRVKMADDYSARFPAVSSAEHALKLATCGWRTNAETAKAEGFEYILRTRTAIGNSRTLFNRAPIVPVEVSLTIVKSPTERIDNQPIPYLYYHPRSHKEIAIDAPEFRDYYQRYKRPSEGKDFRGLYHTVHDVEVGLKRTLRCNVALAAISSTRLSNIEADLGLNEIESGDVAISYGVHLAIDGMPTGLRIDDWDMRGHYLKRYYVVVDAELGISNQLDPGRKGISRYYARMISEKVIDLLNSTVEDSAPFSHYASRHLNHGRGREEGGLPPQDFLLKVRQVKDEMTSDEARQAALVKKVTEISTLIRLPRDEQEVIALFYELLARKHIKGYRTVYLSGKAVYDAALEYEIACTDSNIYPHDPLGLGQVLVQDLRSKGQSRYAHRDHFNGITTFPELCVDFKRDMGAFLEEVIRKPSQSNKDPKAIDLLVVWNLDVSPAVPSNSYTIDAIPGNRRVFHGTTHRLGLIAQHTTEIFCISLSNVLEAI